MSRVCSADACATALGPLNKSGFCRSCLLARRNADPVFQAMRAERSRKGKANQTPESRSAAAKLAAKKRLANPEHRKWLAAHCKSIAPLAHGPEQRVSRAAKLSVIVSDQRLAWCPREHRDLYRQLARKSDAATARAAIEDIIAREKAKAAAERNTFAAKLARVQAGEAGLIDALPNFHLTPTIRRAA